MEIHQIKRSAEELQQPISEVELRAALNRQLPKDTILSVTELSIGLFNNTYEVQCSAAKYILKIAPADDANVLFNEQWLMQREQAIAPYLSMLKPLVPEYLSFFSIAGRDAFLQAFVQGELWFSAMPQLSEAENNLLWQQLGQFAKQCHAIAGKGFGYPEPFKPKSSWSQFIYHNVKGLVENCERCNCLHEEIGRYFELLPSFFSVLDEIKQPCLLHGDLWPRNVLITGSGADIRLQAVIDGERAFWGDPLSDWVLILYDLPDAFWSGYGENLLTNGNSLRISLYRAMYYIVNILESRRENRPDDQYIQLLNAENNRLSLHT